MITDPTFYTLAIVAAILIGLAKGGIGGSVGMLATPLLALKIPPIQAAGILLPILLCSDAVAIWSWRRTVNWWMLGQLLPGAVLGIAIGWFTAAWVTADHIRLIVGIVSFSFAASYWLKLGQNLEPAEPNVIKASFWTTICGFTSFVSHAGGPPYQMYAVPLRLNSHVYVATTAYFFAIVNFVKLLPYFFLGQLSLNNLETAAVLLPVSIAFTYVGIWLVKRLNQAVFYRLIYGFILLVGLKLTWDGLNGIL